MPTDPVSSGPLRAGHFATTRWSVVRAAGQTSTADAKAALESLCRSYWFPLYAFVRRQGYQVAAAQDLTQGFFASLLERNDLRALDPDRGRFRSFLLASLKHFLSNDRDRCRAHKRGGGRAILSLDFDSAESRLSAEPAQRETPQSLFERQWALTLLDHVRERLRNEHETAGKGAQFELLQAYLTGEASAPAYALAAERLGSTEGAVKMAVHRLRRQFRDCLRQEVAQTVASAEEIDDEIRALMVAFQRPG